MIDTYEVHSTPAVVSVEASRMGYIETCRIKQGVCTTMKFFIPMRQSWGIRLKPIEVLVKPARPAPIPYLVM